MAHIRFTWLSLHPASSAVRFDWPAPRELINEGCEEGGGGWRDKSLALWRLDELP